MKLVIPDYLEKTRRSRTRNDLLVHCLQTSLEIPSKASCFASRNRVIFWGLLMNLASVEVRTHDSNWKWRYCASYGGIPLRISSRVYGSTLRRALSCRKSTSRNRRLQESSGRLGHGSNSFPVSRSKDLFNPSFEIYHRLNRKTRWKTSNQICLFQVKKFFFSVSRTGNIICIQRVVNFWIQSIENLFCKIL